MKHILLGLLLGTYVGLIIVMCIDDILPPRVSLSKGTTVYEYTTS